MIRRELEGADWLITQDDHGILAGVCAAHLGNHEFARPQPIASVVSGTRMHDAGWPLHDDNPTIDPQGRPLNVFDRPWNVALEVWGESVDRAIAADAYGGLLASLHAMRITHDLGDRTTPAGAAHIEQFLHLQSAHQTKLRQQLGLRTDLPLTLGLSPPGTSAEEDQLASNFRWLQACDLFSLAVLCTSVPGMSTRQIQRAPGSPPIPLHLRRPEPTVLTVDPWPFDIPTIPWPAPARRLPTRTYPDNASFRAAYQAAPTATLPVELRKP